MFVGLPLSFMSNLITISSRVPSLDKLLPDSGTSPFGHPSTRVDCSLTMRHAAGRLKPARLHQLLGLQPGESYARVRSSYQQAVRRCHPDACSTASDGDCDEFLAVQAAWEEFKASLRRDESGVGGRRGASVNAPFHRRNDLQMILLGLHIESPSWEALIPRTDGVHRLRSAVVQSVCGLCAMHELPPIDVRRVEINHARAEMHIHAEGPRHRDDVVRMCTTSPASFSEALHGALETVGWPLSASAISLRTCLPYTIPAAPVPHPVVEDLALD